jgi:DNA-binding GntR family transcriptional regulator
MISDTQSHNIVADRMRSAIVDGQYKPGEWMRQERIAQELGVSQMPVREALKQLASDGLIEHIPYRGARVVDIHRTMWKTFTPCVRFWKAGRPGLPPLTLWAAFPTMLIGNYHTALRPLAGRDNLDNLEHAAIIEALGNGDADAAQKAMKVHVESVVHELMGMINE